MTRRRWFWSISLVILLTAVGLAAGVRLIKGLSYDRDTFKVLAADVFHPTFYSRFAAAREQQLAWVTEPVAVASEFVGRALNCPSQQLEILSGSEDALVVIITRICPYSNLATRRQFRVDLVRQGAVWEIDWAGLRYKCAVNSNALAVFLLQHNPFRGVQAPGASRAAGAIDTVSDSLNFWLTECP